ncbi:hypothetical protein C8Q75DRAFT_761236 [Abortiporus biennis]|nr:hypothetical protein C8Q75DRAFT_761236 [Abortiporus biennis]
MTNGTNFQRHPQYYLPDGNVVLVAGDIAFRVHGSVLSMHSNVFRDMLGIPKPPNDDYLYDGCPIVPLSDTAEEVLIMLSALYDSISHYEQGRRPLPFKDVAAMLRLGIKYEIDKLRNESVHRFEECFPKSLASFVKLELEPRLTGLSTQSEDEDPELPEIPIQFSDMWEVIGIIPLARQCNLWSVLPQVYYICAQCPIETLFQSLNKSNLSPIDLETIFSLEYLLRGHNLHSLEPFILRNRGQMCIHPAVCGGAWKSLLKDEYSSWLQASDIFKEATIWFNAPAVNAGLCSMCIQNFGEHYDRKRKEQWLELGEMCHVSDWSGEL